MLIITDKRCSREDTYFW